MTKPRRGSTLRRKVIVGRGPKPIKLDYDPLENGQQMQRCLGDMVRMVLDGSIRPRQAATVRGIIETSLRVFEHLGYEEKLDKMLQRTQELHRRLDEYDKKQQKREQEIKA
jgi:hypothetical protein